MKGFYIGDIIGSGYAHNNSYLNKQVKNFKLFTSKSFITDDTVFSFATIEWLLTSKNFSAKKMKSIILNYFSEFHLNNENTYGPNLINWIKSGAKGNRKSTGVGGAMRVSPIGLFAKNEAQINSLVKNAVICTHDTKKGIEGALIVAYSIFWLKNGISKENLKQKLEEKFGLNLNQSLATLKKKKDEQIDSVSTVTPAIIAFLNSRDFEDAIRNAVSIGGDTDTITSISASLAETFYKDIPEILIKKARLFLPEKFIKLEEKFNQVIKGR